MLPRTICIHCVIDCWLKNKTKNIKRCNPGTKPNQQCLYISSQKWSTNDKQSMPFASKARMDKGIYWRKQPMPQLPCHWHWQMKTSPPNIHERRNVNVSQIGHSVILCARTPRTSRGHASTGEHRARFFPNEPTACTLETRMHILIECSRYTKDRITPVL